MSLPAPNTFSKAIRLFFFRNRPCICYQCPPGYKRGPSLTATYSADGGETTTTVTLVPSDDIPFGPGPGWTTLDPEYGTQGSFYLYCTQEVSDNPFCCDENGNITVFLQSFGIPFDPPEDATPMSGFQTFTACHGGTPVPNTITLGAPATDAVDQRLLLDIDGNPWRNGCSLKVDTTFTAAHPTIHGETVQVRVVGDLCVEDPCAPPEDPDYYACVLTRTYPYVSTVLFGNKYELQNVIPVDFLSAVHRKPYVLDDDDPCEGHFTDVDCTLIHPDFTPWWQVEYQDRDGDGNPVGKPYLECHPSRISGIVCRNWYKDFTCDAATPPQPPPPSPPPPPPTVETGQDLDADRDNPPTATTRTRTFVDGPWPDRKYCCLATPACGRMAKARKTAKYDLPDSENGLDWVADDWGKLPGGGPFANEQYLRCKLGWGWNSFDVSSYPGGGPLDGYSLSKKAQFHAILGGPTRYLKGDDEAPESDGTLYEGRVGEVNKWPGPWGDLVNNPGNFSTTPYGSGWAYPTSWWVVRSGVSGFAVVETSHVEIPSLWYAGPFVSPGLTDPDRATAQAAAEAAAASGIAYWCVKRRTLDDDGNDTGPPARTCLPESDTPLPDPQTDPPTEHQIGYTAEGIDPAEDDPDGTESVSLTILDGPWLWVPGTGDDAADLCAKNCEPCGTPEAEPMMMAARSAPVAAVAPRKPVPVMPKAVTVPPRPPCRHELPVVSWASCGEHKHLRGCAVHDLCTRGANDGSVASCRACREYEPAG